MGHAIPGTPGLNDELHLALSREALRQASETLARQAELLADEMALGNLLDRGGPAALRLFAAAIRSTRLPVSHLVGHA